MKHRYPMPNRRFSWGCMPSDGICTWRLFRRDIGKRVHMSIVQFHRNADRTLIASTLRHSRNRLRDRVDALDFATLGIAA